ncbi:MAG TPA: Ldh family oxidoreductase, partial [Burkholderiaceae bacterium]|nr:Ldh family oxidoreductase [Burkholderiaceae bacterium]
MTIFADADRLQAFVTTIFTTAGSSAAEADQIASHLVGANLAGHDSHGIGLIPTYLAHRQAGLVRPNQMPVRVGGVGPFAVFDGQMGYGQPITNAVMAQAATIAREVGVALVTLRNVQHVGRIGAYAETLAAQGLMS